MSNDDDRLHTIIYFCIAMITGKNCMALLILLNNTLCLMNMLVWVRLL